MRLYRGRGNNKPEPGEEQYSGRWFTDDLSVAQEYGREVVYLDLCDTFCENFRAPGKPPHEFLVPEGWLYHVLVLREEDQ